MPNYSKSNPLALKSNLESWMTTIRNYVPTSADISAILANTTAYPTTNFNVFNASGSPIQYVSTKINIGFVPVDGTLTSSTVLSDGSGNTLTVSNYLNSFLSNQTENNYVNLITAIYCAHYYICYSSGYDISNLDNQYSSSTSNISSYKFRFLFVLDDGTILCDSSKLFNFWGTKATTDTNSGLVTANGTGFQGKAINENHHSRPEEIEC